MIRTSLLTLAVSAMLALAAVSSTTLHAQQSQARSVALDQTLIDRWLVAMPAIVAFGQSASAPQTDEAARQLMQRICADAGFHSTEQCGEVTGYIGMIVSACDRRSRAFRDPIPLMRRHLERLERDTSMPPDARDKTIADVKDILSAFPDGFPAEHIQLMNANRDRIFATLISLRQ